MRGMEHVAIHAHRDECGETTFTITTTASTTRTWQVDSVGLTKWLEGLASSTRKLAIREYGEGSERWEW